jgi:tRNA (Thr-GGU) A37 N-methylase
MSQNFNFIGYIETPYNSLAECPKNISFNGPLCKLFINDDLKTEIRGLKIDQKIMVLYFLGDKEDSTIESNSIKKCPHSHNKDLGIFAKRSPHRPNPIGVAILPIVDIDFDKGIIYVKGLDCLNKTKLLDIKPAIYLENK